MVLLCMSIVSPIVNFVEINIPRKAAPKKSGDLIPGCKEPAIIASFLILGLPNRSLCKHGVRIEKQIIQREQRGI